MKYRIEYSLPGVGMQTEEVECKGYTYLEDFVLFYDSFEEAQLEFEADKDAPATNVIIKSLSDTVFALPKKYVYTIKKVTG